ncbi:hypothetical protein [Ensifer sp. MJa1]|uniref:hypothetical protein n=1 Tax=Ensifer sp. MJa1 TaxID=2919888 RepID=UPI00300AE57A
MSYFGGMTLGYLAPPAPKATLKPAKTEAVANVKANDNDDADRDQEWARAFMTPWHLFY